jgi:class 3 adenylate cyclase
VGFYDVLDQVLELLCQRGRVTYRALKREFHLDDEALEDLKEALLFAHPVVDQDGRGLLWTGDPAAPEPASQRGADAESRFHELILTMIGLLQRERRITYRRLKHVFRLDDVLLEDVRKEILFTQVARDEQGEGLVWIGATPPVTSLEVDVSSPSDIGYTTTVSSPVPATLPPHIPETHAPSHEPLFAPASLPTDVPHDELAVTTESARRVPEAEHRQLTVMFCDLADSTKLSQLLDPEDLREVVRAYQETAVVVILQYEGHIAQYLGDGLLIYFGWPIAHEDDAQRALYSGLGIVNAITSSLNPRLHQEKGVQLTVRLGIHTGPVVVGEMGSGGRHENLATGETVHIAARLEGLAAPNTVVISQVTARLVRDAFVLESLGPHALKGVAEPMPVFRVDGVRQADAEDSGRGGFEVLIGRDEEIGLLLRRWEQSKEGLGQVVLISGEAGIGKSRLVEGLRQHVRQEGYTRIAFRCSEYVQQSALYPVIEHLYRVLDWQRSDTPPHPSRQIGTGAATVQPAFGRSCPAACYLAVPAAA